MSRCRVCEGAGVARPPDWRAPRTADVAAADGRLLRVVTVGDLARPVVIQVGTPNAAVLYDPWIRDAEARRLSLICYDRPGYGASTPDPGRTIASCARDVATVIRALGIDRCAVWGFSGGGPHALACAALLGSSVVAVATIGSPAPRDAAGLDFFDGMRDGARADIQLCESDRAQWDRNNAAQYETLMAMSEAEFAEAFGAGTARVDQDVLRGSFGGWMYRTVRAALAPGFAGWADDDVAIFHSPWGFSPAGIAVPVKLWHGTADCFVPLGHARWLATAILGAELQVDDGGGHLGVAADRIAEVHGWLERYL